MEIGQTAVVRFLPDADESNPLGFLVENKYHILNINGKKKQIACLKMYGEPCPCCEKSSKYYNEGNKDMGKIFWRKIDYVGGVLVLHSPFDYPIPAEGNPERLVSLGPKIYQRIESAIVAGDMDSMPYDLQTGYDFRINKTKQGEYADYTTSDFARKESAAPAELISRVTPFYNLKDYRFAKIERDQMETMIQAFETGKSYDEGHEASAPAVDSPKETKPADEVVQQVKAAAPTESADGGKLSPQQIIAKLKARSQTAS
jgi:hypothetical protein